MSSVNKYKQLQNLSPAPLICLSKDTDFKIFKTVYLKKKKKNLSYSLFSNNNK